MLANKDISTSEGTAEIGRNIDEELLDIIDRYDDVDDQQACIDRVLIGIPLFTVARRIYSTLFPFMETYNRRAGG